VLTLALSSIMAEFSALPDFDYIPPPPQLGENFASERIREFACVIRSLAPFTPTLTTLEIISVLSALHPLDKNPPYSDFLLDF
jgi:hypothetical protein